MHFEWLGREVWNPKVMKGSVESSQRPNKQEGSYLVWTNISSQTQGGTGPGQKEIQQRKRFQQVYRKGSKVSKLLIWLEVGLVGINISSCR